MSQGAPGALAGAWVFVCGPSGSGKDSVMQWAQHALKDRPDIVFSRRNVTRPAQPGSDHDPMTAEEFSTQRQTAALRWHWEAHGFGYGISSRYADEVVRGKIVVVNGSRAHLLDVMDSVSATELRVVQVVAAPAAMTGPWLGFPWAR